ncbi:hypothetical protein BESB_005970 [Besnoitia besnoiti]|uniref:Uncharacterized protein n=1 Tax=Besnoitia besnoiti TaxID=94643 RepID=A0A2A9MPH7_BESBE|nr:hypothetical protein BESB_005970 [Besnoitia besnoiti]PFH38256.1 hypothetical protein BESB_005970 [Besnoitia besnoiti]
MGSSEPLAYMPAGSLGGDGPGPAFGRVSQTLSAAGEGRSPSSPFQNSSLSLPPQPPSPFLSPLPSLGSSPPSTPFRRWAATSPEAELERAASHHQAGIEPAAGRDARADAADVSPRSLLPASAAASLPIASDPGLAREPGAERHARSSVTARDDEQASQSRNSFSLPPVVPESPFSKVGSSSLSLLPKKKFFQPPIRPCATSPFASAASGPAPAPGGEEGGPTSGALPPPRGASSPFRVAHFASSPTSFYGPHGTPGRGPLLLSELDTPFDLVRMNKGTIFLAGKHAKTAFQPGPSPLEEIAETNRELVASQDTHAPPPVTGEVLSKSHAQAAPLQREETLEEAEGDEEGDALGGAEDGDGEGAFSDPSAAAAEAQETRGRGGRQNEEGDLGLSTPQHSPTRTDLAEAAAASQAPEEGAREEERIDRRGRLAFDSSHAYTPALSVGRPAVEHGGALRQHFSLGNRESARGFQAARDGATDPAGEGDGGPGADGPSGERQRAAARGFDLAGSDETEEAGSVEEAGALRLFSPTSAAEQEILRSQKLLQKAERMLRASTPINFERSGVDGGGRRSVSERRDDFAASPDAPRRQGEREGLGLSLAYCARAPSNLPPGVRTPREGSPPRAETVALLSERRPSRENASTSLRNGVEAAEGENGVEHACEAAEFHKSFGLSSSFLDSSRHKPDAIIRPSSEGGGGGLPLIEEEENLFAGEQKRSRGNPLLGSWLLSHPEIEQRERETHSEEGDPEDRRPDETPQISTSTREGAGPRGAQPPREQPKRGTTAGSASSSSAPCGPKSAAQRGHLWASSAETLFRASRRQFLHESDLASGHWQPAPDGRAPFFLSVDSRLAHLYAEDAHSHAVLGRVPSAMLAAAHPSEAPQGTEASAASSQLFSASGFVLPPPRGLVDGRPNAVERTGAQGALLPHREEDFRLRQEGKSESPDARLQPRRRAGAPGVTWNVETGFALKSSSIWHQGPAGGRSAATRPGHGELEELHEEERHDEDSFMGGGSDAHLPAAARSPVSSVSPSSLAQSFFQGQGVPYEELQLPHGALERRSGEEDEAVRGRFPLYASSPGRLHLVHLPADAPALSRGLYASVPASASGSSLAAGGFKSDGYGGIGGHSRLRPFAFGQAPSSPFSPPQTSDASATPSALRHHQGLLAQQFGASPAAGPFFRQAPFAQSPHRGVRAGDNQLAFTADFGSPAITDAENTPSPLSFRSVSSKSMSSSPSSLYYRGGLGSRGHFSFSFSPGRARAERRREAESHVRATASPERDPDAGTAGSAPYRPPQTDADGRGPRGDARTLHGVPLESRGDFARFKAGHLPSHRGAEDSSSFHGRAARTSAAERAACEALLGFVREGAAPQDAAGLLPPHSSFASSRREAAPGDLAADGEADPPDAHAKDVRKFASAHRSQRESARDEAKENMSNGSCARNETFPQRPEAAGARVQPDEGPDAATQWVGRLDTERETCELAARFNEGKPHATATGHRGHPPLSSSSSSAFAQGDDLRARASGRGPGDAADGRAESWRDVAYRHETLPEAQAFEEKEGAEHYRRRGQATHLYFEERATASPHERAGYLGEEPSHEARGHLGIPRGPARRSPDTQGWEDKDRGRITRGERDASVYADARELGTLRVEFTHRERGAPQAQEAESGAPHYGLPSSTADSDQVYGQQMRESGLLVDRASPAEERRKTQAREVARWAARPANPFEQSLQALHEDFAFDRVAQASPAARLAPSSPRASPDAASPVADSGGDGRKAAARRHAECGGNDFPAPTGLTPGLAAAEGTSEGLPPSAEMRGNVQFLVAPPAVAAADSACEPERRETDEEEDVVQALLPMVECVNAELLAAGFETLEESGVPVTALARPPAGSGGAGQEEMGSGEAAALSRGNLYAESSAEEGTGRRRGEPARGETGGEEGGVARAEAYFESPRLAGGGEDMQEQHSRASERNAEIAPLARPPAPRKYTTTDDAYIQADVYVHRVLEAMTDKLHEVLAAYRTRGERMGELRREAAVAAGLAAKCNGLKEEKEDLEKQLAALRSHVAELEREKAQLSATISQQKGFASRAQEAERACQILRGQVKLQKTQLRQRELEKTRVAERLDAVLREDQTREARARRTLQTLAGLRSPSSASVSPRRDRGWEKVAAGPFIKPSEKSLAQVARYYEGKLKALQRENAGLANALQVSAQTLETERAEREQTHPWAADGDVAAERKAREGFPTESHMHFSTVRTPPATLQRLAELRRARRGGGAALAAVSGAIPSLLPADGDAQGDDASPFAFSSPASRREGDNEETRTRECTLASMTGRRREKVEMDALASQRRSRSLAASCVTQSERDSGAERRKRFSLSCCSDSRSRRTDVLGTRSACLTEAELSNAAAVAKLRDEKIRLEARLEQLQRAAEEMQQRLRMRTSELESRLEEVEADLAARPTREAHMQLQQQLLELQDELNPKKQESWRCADPRSLMRRDRLKQKLHASAAEMDRDDNAALLETCCVTVNCHRPELLPAVLKRLTAATVDKLPALERFVEFVALVAAAKLPSAAEADIILSSLLAMNLARHAHRNYLQLRQSLAHALHQRAASSLCVASSPALQEGRGWRALSPLAEQLEAMERVHTRQFQRLQQTHLSRVSQHAIGHERERRVRETLALLRAQHNDAVTLFQAAAQEEVLALRDLVSAASRPAIADSPAGPAADARDGERSSLRGDRERDQTARELVEVLQRRLQFRTSEECAAKVQRALGRVDALTSFFRVLCGVLHIPTAVATFAQVEAAVSTLIEESRQQQVLLEEQQKYLLRQHNLLLSLQHSSAYAPALPTICEAKAEEEEEDARSPVQVAQPRDREAQQERGDEPAATGRAADAGKDKPEERERIRVKDRTAAAVATVEALQRLLKVDRVTLILPKLSEILVRVQRLTNAPPLSPQCAEDS